jgi:hypothetical protein
LADGTDVHPAPVVTVKLYVFAANAEIVAVVPVPVIDPGLMVQFPAGKPFNITLPVRSAQSGCVIEPTNGAVGVAGCTLITTLADKDEVHPAELVTVKLYVPEASPGIVVFVPDPVIPPGLIVHVPTDGKPFSTTLPVAVEQVG